MRLKLVALAVLFGLSASADPYMKNQGGQIGRADGGFLPVQFINCGTDLVCTQDRASGTGTITLNGWRGCGSYDFPAATCLAGTSGPCYQDSWAITAKGMQVGDYSAAVSNNFGVDGGARLTAPVWLECIPGNNSFVIREHFGDQNDGGSVNLTDAGYCCMCFSG